MVVIAIDTSQQVGSAALARRGELLGERRFGVGSSHLVELGAAVDELLRAAAMDAAALDRIALVTGPGSFTGLRIGMAYVKGLHAGLGVELAVMNTLELMALPLLEDFESACCMLDARRDEVYAAVYRRGAGDAPFRAAVVRAPCAMAPERFLGGLAETPAVFVGSGARRYREMVTPFLADAALAEEDADQSSTAWLARIGHQLAPLAADAVRDLEPDYIRASGARMKPLKPIDPDD